MEIYQVIHEYDEDGGFGDAVPEERVVAIFTKEEDAHAFVEKYAKPHAYDKPYSYLWCGELSVRVVKISNSLEEFETENGTDFWWLTNKVLEVNRDDDDEDDGEEDGIILNYHRNSDTNELTIYEGQRVLCTFSDVFDDDEAERLFKETEYEYNQEHKSKEDDEEE